MYLRILNWKLWVFMDGAIKVEFKTTHVMYRGNMQPSTRHLLGGRKIKCACAMVSLRPLNYIYTKNRSTIIIILISLFKPYPHHKPDSMRGQCEFTDPVSIYFNHVRTIVLKCERMRP